MIQINIFATIHYRFQKYAVVVSDFSDAENVDNDMDQCL